MKVSRIEPGTSENSVTTCTPALTSSLIASLTADDSDWAAKELATLRTKSPQTCKVALRQLLDSLDCADFAANMAMEYRIASRVLTLPDFAEGVRALIIGLLGLLYAGLGWLSALRDALIVVFELPGREQPNFVMGKVRDLIMLVVIGTVLMVAVGFTGLVSGFSQDLLDWAGLKARFTAAHALRRAVAEAGEHAPGGNFSEDAALFFAASREASTAVNPNDLANGKALDAIDITIVGTTPQIDDRGQV